MEATEDQRPSFPSFPVRKEAPARSLASALDYRLMKALLASSARAASSVCGPALRQGAAVALSRKFSAAALPPFQYEGLFQSTGPLPYPYRKV